MTMEPVADPAPPSPYDRYHRWLRSGMIGAMLLELLGVIYIANSEAYQGTRAMRVFVLWVLIATTIYGYISYERHNRLALAQDADPIRLLITRFFVLVGTVLISGALLLVA